MNNTTEEMDLEAANSLLIIEHNASEKANLPHHFSDSARKRLWYSLMSKIKENLLLLLTLGGVIFGFGLGFLLRQYGLPDAGLMWLGACPGVSTKYVAISALEILYKRWKYCANQYKYKAK